MTRMHGGYRITLAGRNGTSAAALYAEKAEHDAIAAAHLEAIQENKARYEARCEAYRLGGWAIYAMFAEGNPELAGQHARAAARQAFIAHPGLTR